MILPEIYKSNYKILIDLNEKIFQRNQLNYYAPLHYPPVNAMDDYDGNVDFLGIFQNSLKVVNSLKGHRSHVLQSTPVFTC